MLTLTLTSRYSTHTYTHTHTHTHTRTHTRYRFCAADSHDAHHEYFTYHFGVGGPWDKLCGTDYAGSELQKRNVRKAEAEVQKVLKAGDAKND